MYRIARIHNSYHIVAQTLFRETPNIYASTHTQTQRAYNLCFGRSKAWKFAQIYFISGKTFDIAYLAYAQTKKDDQVSDVSALLYVARDIYLYETSKYCKHEDTRDALVFRRCYTRQEFRAHINLNIYKTLPPRDIIIIITNLCAHLNAWCAGSWALDCYWLW